jgi:hypothetical protein
MVARDGLSGDGDFSWMNSYPPTGLPVPQTGFHEGLVPSLEAAWEVMRRPIG